MVQVSTVAANNYQQLVDMFTASGEMSYYDTRNHSICLKNMPNNTTDIRELRKRIRSITEKFRLIVVDPFEMNSSMNILNIEL